MVSVESSTSSVSSLSFSSSSASLTSIYFVKQQKTLQDPQNDDEEFPNVDMVEERLNCFELMSLLHLQDNQELWDRICEAVLCYDKVEPKGKHFQSERLCRLASSLPREFWFIAVHCQNRADRIINFVKQLPDPGERLLAGYLQSFNLSVLYLDNVFEVGEKAKIPVELFRHCPAIRVLSLKNNYLQTIPADIGRLSRLESLYLTNNRLENWSIPYTLSFCHKLKEIYLDNNLLDALPSVLLTMTSLRTVHRHGNHNYFKSTFMWYHTDVNGRILESAGRRIDPEDEVELGGSNSTTLQTLSSKAIISAKLNFFAAPDTLFPNRVKNEIAVLSGQINRCGNCAIVKSASDPGFKVFTFKNPYLGNTCVPFLHWACSYVCAEKIEIPARNEQLLSAREQDRLYEKYVRESVDMFGPKKRRKRRRAAEPTSNPRSSEDQAYQCNIL